MANFQLGKPEGDRQLTVSSSAWFPIRNVFSSITQDALEGHVPDCHSSIESGNQEGGSRGDSIRAACVRGGYRGQVRRARNSNPFPV